MLSIKTLTSLLLVIITVLIITVILMRISQPTEVRAVGAVYDEFFGDTNPPPSSLLTLEDGRIILHCEKAKEWEITLTTPDGIVRCRDAKAHLVKPPEQGIGVYTLTVRKGNERLVQMYALRTPRVTRKPLREIIQPLLTILREKEDFFDDCKGKQPFHMSFIIQNPPICTHITYTEGLERNTLPEAFQQLLEVPTLTACSACLREGSCSPDTQTLLFWLSYRVLTDKQWVGRFFTRFPRLPQEVQERLIEQYKEEAKQFTLSQEGISCSFKLNRLK